ncbi:hypothetical protein [uncultured Parabacteroides sp.]|uniref:hypothetical protein n=1 Tax=uncultured Parabacteroides sp. TaxID=512312 RepID=UPI0025F62BD2|nr:hypothetical protein [uncultured Parabacteroides sp.]
MRWLAASGCGEEPHRDAVGRRIGMRYHADNGDSEVSPYRRRHADFPVGGYMRRKQ